MLIKAQADNAHKKTGLMWQMKGLSRTRSSKRSTVDATVADIDREPSVKDLASFNNWLKGENCDNAGADGCYVADTLNVKPANVKDGMKGRPKDDTYAFNQVLVSCFAYSLLNDANTFGIAANTPGVKVHAGTPAGWSDGAADLLAYIQKLKTVGTDIATKKERSLRAQYLSWSYPVKLTHNPGNHANPDLEDRSFTICGEAIKADCPNRYNANGKVCVWDDTLTLCKDSDYLPV
jgi:hypothetical protein